MQWNKRNPEKLKDYNYEQKLSLCMPWRHTGRLMFSFMS